MCKCKLCSSLLEDQIRQWYGHPIAEADVEIFQIVLGRIFCTEHSIYVLMIPFL
jgi:hypothetical protein